MNRRGFLAACAAAMMATAVATKLGDTVTRLSDRLVHILHGDGKHDDTAALQALLDGDAVWDARTGREKVVVDGFLDLSGGTFAVYDTRRVRGSVLWTNDARFEGHTPERVGTVPGADGSLPLDHLPQVRRVLWDLPAIPPGAWQGWSSVA